MKVPLREYWNLLFTYLTSLWKKVLLLAFLFFSGIGLELINPQIMRYFIDIATSGGALERLTAAAMLFLVVGLIGKAVSALTSYVSDAVGWEATNRLRSDMVLHALQLDMSFHNNHTPGELIERIDGDVSRLANFFSQFVIQLLGGLLLSFCVLILLYYENWRIGLAMTAFVGIYLFTHIRGQRISVPYWRAERQATGDLFGFLGERFSGVRDIRTNGAVAYVLRRFHELMRRTFLTGLKADIVTDVGWTISNIVFALGYAVAMALSAYLFELEAITIGTVYLIIHYIHMLRMPLNTVTRQVEDLQRVKVSVERVKELMETQPEIQSGENISIPGSALSVEFEDVSFSYVGGRQVLKDLSFRLESGRVLGLLGRTGSGKTTLSRLLFRFYPSNKGTIRLGDVDVRQMRLFDLRQRVGLVTQEVQLFQASIRDNLTMFDQTIRDEQVLDGLNALGLEEWYRRLPEGLDTVLGPSGEGLSAGEAQLLAFTRVFLKDPGLLILDEASSRLDPSTEGLLSHAMDGLVKNRTAIIIAHRLSTVRQVDEIMILEAGEIKEHEAYHRLASEPGSLFYRLLKTGLEEVLQ